MVRFVSTLGFLALAGNAVAAPRPQWKRQDSSAKLLTNINKMSHYWGGYTLICSLDSCVDISQANSLHTTTTMKMLSVWTTLAFQMVVK